MRVMLVHTETSYFGGAQKMLGYFLEETVARGDDVVVAMAENSRVRDLIPKGVHAYPIHRNQTFSLSEFGRQVQDLRAIHRLAPVDIFHGWTARDWELTGVTSMLLRRPAVGTLHDHPEAGFRTKKRQRLMRLISNFALRKVVCVSEAVRLACKNAHYSGSKLQVIHNGLPNYAPPDTTKHDDLRIGYLGALSESKGFRGLFEILAEFSKTQPIGWNMAIAGEPQNEEGKQLVETLRAHYTNAEWWPSVQWLGWAKDPLSFLVSLDVLIVPSQEFDAFPTVLLEAGKVGIPVVVADVGGAKEIVKDGETGRIFAPGDWKTAARYLAEMAINRQRTREMGLNAYSRLINEFSAEKMVATYFELYLAL